MKGTMVHFDDLIMQILINSNQSTYILSQPR